MVETENLLGIYPNYRKALSSMDAAAGVIRYRLDEGPGNGMRVAEVYTAAGLRYSVLLDRGMDIGAASFRGIPIAYVAKGGAMGTAAAAAQNFHSYFTGGLVYTCGLDNIGEPCESSGKMLPMHGFRTFLPAFDIYSAAEPENGVIRVRGKMRSASLFGENILLVREIISGIENGCIEIIDTIENQGSSVFEYMLMYHINFGFPLVSPDSTVRTNHKKVYYLETSKIPNISEYRNFIEPQKSFSELVFEMHEPDEKQVTAVLENPRLGLIANISCNSDELKCFTQWVNMAEQDYVLGLEPGTHYPIGRNKAAASGGLASLESGQKIIYNMNISVKSK